MTIVEESTIVDAAPWTPSPSAPEHPFSTASGPLFGRQTGRALVSDLFGRPDVRLVTLTGAGEVGKTRLAREVILDQRVCDPDGVTIVQLASLADSKHVLSATAKVFGLPVTKSTALLASEVLRQVASGWTNAETAEALFLSPRTVGAHLQRIYARLDVSNRSSATHVAIERGLV